MFNKDTGLCRYFYILRKGMRKVLIQSVCLFLLCTGQVFANFVEDESDPRTPEMDKEEARLNELNNRLADIGRAYDGLKRIHLLLVANALVDADTNQQGERIVNWHGSITAVLGDLSAAIDTYMLGDIENRSDLDTNEEWTARLSSIRNDLENISLLQAEEAEDYIRISSALVQINEIIKKVPVYDDNYLNEVSSEDYSETIKTINEYSGRIRTSVFSLNNAVEELNRDSLNNVINAFSESIHAMNAAYALEMPELKNTISEVENLIAYSKFIRVAGKSVYVDKNTIHTALLSGRVSRAEKSYDKLQSEIQSLISNYESLFDVKIDDVVESDNHLYDVHVLFVGFITQLDADVSAVYSEEERPGYEELALRLERYIKDLFKSRSSGLQRFCASNDSEADLERKANINCKAAKELSVFYGVDLAEVTEYDKKVIDAEKKENPDFGTKEAILAKLRLIEEKINQVYIVNE